MRRFLFLSALTMSLAGCTPWAGQAVGELRLDEPWARATPPGSSVSGGFLTIRNLGSSDDRLVSASTSAAAEVQIHEMSTDGGMMRMRQLEDGLAIPAGAAVALQPGGYHLMFMRPKRPFQDGDVVMATLTFEHAGSVEVSFQVRGAGARSGGGHAHH